MVTFLQEKYESVATIFLHGSRARGKHGKYSDWDFIIFTHTTLDQDQFRAELEGEEIEWEIFSLPVSDSLIHNLSPKLRDAQLLFDTNKIGEEIIGRVNERLKKGLPESSRTIEKHVSAKSFVVSKLGRMIDTQNDMEMYIKYSSVFYLKMVNNWYNFLHYEYSKNLYNALPEIETRDPVFRKMIHDFIFGSPVQQIEVGRQMISHIFKN